jgi:two-component system, OmpR family, sensor histidine kinase TctE
MPDGRRTGIRALLLALLLPATTALLAFDAWRDHRGMAQAVLDAQDQILVEPVQALGDSIRLDAAGRPHLDAAFSVQAMFASTRARDKQLRVGATPLAADGTARGPEEILLGPQDLPAAPAGPDDALQFYDASYLGQPLRIAALRRSLHAGDAPGYRVLIQAAEGTAAREQVLADAWRRALVGELLLVALMVLLLWLGVALALRPLERLRRALAERRPGDLEPLDLRGVPLEVEPLVKAVNHHVAAQGRMLQEQRRFLADASHQLRTPLAIMLTQAGYALRESDPGTLRETLGAIVGQLARARRVCEQLLALAQAQGGEGEPGPARRDALADLNAVARDVVLQYLPLAREKQQDLGFVDARGEGIHEDSASDPPAAPVAADAAELHEALANLVDNAIAYTPARGRITVTVRCADDRAEAEVCDSGPGIPAPQRSAVFERFQRGEGLQQPQGAGLGLAIARAYARRNGGDISLDEAPAVEGLPGGLRAILALPLFGSNPISDNTYFEVGGAH